jgi:hypothetical protein
MINRREFTALRFENRPTRASYAARRDVTKLDPSDPLSRAS